MVQKSVFDLDIQELDSRLEMAGMDVQADWGSGSASAVGPVQPDPGTGSNPWSIGTDGCNTTPLTG